MGEEAKASQVLSEALKVVKTIRSAYAKPSALAKVVLKYIEAGLYKEALAIAETIEDVYYRPRMLAEVALEYARDGEKGKASLILSEALDITKKIPSAFYKAWALAEIAAKYTEAKVEVDDGMRKILHEIIKEFKDHSY